MWNLFLKEIRSFFSSLVGYVVIVVFLVAMGLFVWIFPQTSLLDYGFADLYTFFSIAPYVFLFLIPAITMRLLAEEKRIGTMELLLTKPLSDWQIVLGKFLAAWVIVIFALLPTLIYYFSVYQLGTPIGNIDTAAVVGSYLGLVLLGGVFSAIGILSSSLTENQIVAFILAIFFSFLLYEGFTSLSNLDVWSDTAYFVSQLGIDYHYQSVSKGLIDSRNIIYLVSLIFFLLASTVTVLSSRKWE